MQGAQLGAQLGSWAQSGRKRKADGEQTVSIISAAAWRPQVSAGPPALLGVSSWIDPLVLPGRREQKGLALGSDSEGPLPS